ncbi:SPOR domain-containing protein [Acinetobacter sp. MD2(2019)]|uniref:SPOR domain-containing protein n=1 Tax=Acinetobacter sp. MD2(2019) TaxID=2605273 RepID=UPI002D1E87A9|nr:SPOR domain-containing protein [Acinetobacter sp. MD2(2019)]MEB3754996.1 SPOR domain-containing protein [Acinetobacter sp. MD2(2019)]
MFGKTQRGVSERPKQQKQPWVPKWMLTLLAILLILTGAMAFVLWKPWAPVQPRTEITAGQDQEETNKDYRFYDQLPKQQVTPIPEQAVPDNQAKNTAVIVEAPTQATEASNSASDAATTPSINYILQIKSFTDPDSADAKRAEIIMNKLPADVITAQEGGKTWYRVISGPFSTQSAAIAAQQTLQNSGIDSIVVKR